MSTFETFDPSRHQVLKTYSYASEKEIETALEKLRLASKSFLSIAEKKQVLQKLAKGLRDNKEKLAVSMAMEMGKPLEDGRVEVEKSATAADYYVETVEENLKSEKLLVGKNPYEIWAQPSGPLFAIMPWNFPIWQIMRVLAPAIAVGNPVCLKHSDLVVGTAQIFSEIVQAACGENFFQFLKINHEQSAKLIADSRIRCVTMTGSSVGGREVAVSAGRALKKVVLELGGSDAYLVFDDADIEKAATLCAQSRLVNNGQSCVSAKRFIVHENVFDQFVSGFIPTLEKSVIGDPQKAGVTLGPLANEKFRMQLQKQVDELQKQGGRLLYQKKMDLPSELQKGAFFAPQIWQVGGREELVRGQEFFGPVALVMKFKTEQEALELANASVYGLGGAVFSQDLGKCERVARQMECGFVAVNDFVRSDPHVPFGGVKDSGFGRELSHHGMREFVNFKTLGGRLNLDR